MKTFFFSSLTAVTILFTACSDNSSKTGEKAINNKDSVSTSADVNTTESQSSAMTQDIVTGYLNLKNALTEDNGKEAAEAANEETQGRPAERDGGQVGRDQEAPLQRAGGDGNFATSFSYPGLDFWAG